MTTTPGLKRHSICRICGSNKLDDFLSLGKMPLANAFLKKEDFNKEKKYPLRVCFCKNCGLVQLRDIVHHELLYTRYDYMSSASKPLVDYLEKLGSGLADKFVKSKNDLVIDIGGNDGVLLGSIKDRCRVLNVEPAARIAKISRSRGVETVNDFFSSKLARKILDKFGPARAVTANNVVAHIDNLHDFVEGIKLLITDDGVFSFDVHWVGNLIGEGGFDQIYHEHLCYFSLYALQQLADTMSLKLFDVQLTSMHGASLRVFMAKDRAINKSVGEFIKKEKKLGLDKFQTYLAFAKRVEKNKKELRTLLINLKKQGKKIIGYGAPAKGNTLLNFCGIDKRQIDFIIDTTPFKQGLYTPGGHILVKHPDEFKKYKPDYVVLLAWNYADVILKNEDKYRKNGGKFIIPVPSARVV